jgi:hypothetical protein
MKLLSWNCRGLGKPRAVRALKRLLTVNCPDVVFIMETKLTDNDGNIKAKLCHGSLTNYFLVNCSTMNSGRCGGIVLLWNDTVNINISLHNENYIDFYVASLTNNYVWRATGLYGYPKHTQKALTCNLINYLHQLDPNQDWLLFGDFNIVLNNFEKRGGNLIDHNISRLFHETLTNCDLHDLGYDDNIFTWANNQADNHHIKERLDRFCSSSSWAVKFPNFSIKHLLRYTSDHNPILLDFCTHFNFRNSPKNKQKIRRFEHIWIQDKESHQLVKDTWVNCGGDISNKLKKVFNNLHSWGQAKYGIIPRKINMLQRQLQQLKDTMPSKEDIIQIQLKEQELDDTLKLEELWWAQRAKVNWLTHGDKNSKFFHYKANQRRRKNKISVIDDIHGNSCHDETQIHHIFIDYFKNIFHTSNPSNMQDTINLVKDRISPDMKDYLQIDYTEVEVHKAMKHMKSNAAPGPDGLTALFYKKYWEIIGPEITQYVLQFLNNSGSLSLLRPIILLSVLFLRSIILKCHLTSDLLLFVMSSLSSLQKP